MLAGTRLTANFTAGELGAHLPGVSAAIVANLRQTAEWLEAARRVLEVPLRVTSGYRSPAVNLAVGGATTSDHPRGLAADFVPVGLSLFAAYQRLQEGQMPAWDQLIYYPVDGHIHVSVGRARREVRIKLAEGYPFATADSVARLPGGPRAGVASVGVLGLLLIGFLLYLVFGAY